MTCSIHCSTHRVLDYIWCYVFELPSSSTVSQWSCVCVFFSFESFIVEFGPRGAPSVAPTPQARVVVKVFSDFCITSNTICPSLAYSHTSPPLYMSIRGISHQPREPILMNHSLFFLLVLRSVKSLLLSVSKTIKTQRRDM